VTARGFGKAEMQHIAALIIKVITHHEDKKVLEEVRQEVAQFCRRFPVPGIDD
jgi:glycine/serine hydroxymethyltransferase